MIIANQLRFALPSWSDRLMALAVLVIALAAAISALSDRSLIFAATAVAAVAAAAGTAAARMIERRLDFHSADGVLAADALREAARRHYALAMHVPVGTVVSFVAGMGRPAAAVAAPVSYVIGAGACHLACRFGRANQTPRRPSPLRAIRPVLQRPISGALAAIPAFLLLLLTSSIEPGPMAAFMGLISAVAALLLTSVDHAIVRFMTESGYSAWRIVGVHARSLSVYLIVAVFAALVSPHKLSALVILGVVLAALILMASRILAYRVHEQRKADLLVSIAVGAVCLSGFAMPMLSPVVVIAVLWHLHHHAAPATWLLR